MYLEFNNAVRGSYVQNILHEWRPHCHIEIAKGSREDNFKYCTKSSSRIDDEVAGPFWFGDWDEDMKERARMDLTECVMDIKKGATDRELLDKHASSFVRYHKGLQVVRLVVGGKRTWESTCVYIYGNAGAGKTKFVGDICDMDKLYWKSPNSNWFDGYQAEPDVLFDDFDYSWFEFRFLLQLLQPWPMKVPYKGGFYEFLAKTIWFTSNELPHELYKFKFAQNPQNLIALLRRIHYWMFVPERGKYFIFDTYAEFIDKVKEYNGWVSVEQGLLERAEAKESQTKKKDTDQDDNVAGGFIQDQDDDDELTKIKMHNKNKKKKYNENDNFAPKPKRNYAKELIESMGEIQKTLPIGGDKHLYDPRFDLENPDAIFYKQGVEAHVTRVHAQKPDETSGKK